MLLSAVTLPLAGCAAEPPHPPATPDASDAPSATPPPSATPTPTPSAPVGPHEPTRDEIVARFGAQQPAYWSSGEFSPLPGLVRTTGNDRCVLTFDACGGPAGSGIDTELLALLRDQRIPAVLFLNQRWLEANPAEFARIAAEPDLFDIGNHGTRHCPLSVSGHGAYKELGTRDAGEVYDEVMGNHRFLTAHLGKPPRFFRTGTAWYDEVAIQIVRACGELPIGFSVNGDAGTTYTADQVARETGRARAGSVVIAHMNQPARATFEGMRVALPALRARGVRFAKLSECPVS